MIKVGLVDCDTSHVVQFSMRMNHVEIDEEQWVDGANVVAAVPGTSKITPQETLDEYVEKLKSFGIDIVDTPEDLLGKVDAVCVESQGGFVHLDRVTPFLKAGIPCFVDKPFACTVEHARAMADLAAAKLEPIAAKMRRLMASADYIDGILKNGGERAAAMAEPNLAEIKKIIGLLDP